MGHKDLMRIWPLVQEARRLEKEFNWGFTFKWDQGSYESRIDINEFGYVKLGNGKPPLEGDEMFCPDILVLLNGKIIGCIEYEEEATVKKKGHFPDCLNKRDSRRDRYYRKGKLKLGKIWQSDDKWPFTLKRFLIDWYLDAVCIKPQT